MEVKKKGPGRPRKDESRAESTGTRPAKRVPISGFRDKLSVGGRDDDNYVYRWALDSNEGGQRIMALSAAGYEFVTGKDGITVGQGNVYKSDNVGSIIRTPGGNGDFLYLMRISKEFYEEDCAAKEDINKSIEDGMKRSTGKSAGADDLYGSVEIG
tara:strand:+ start:1671 stop:2138 length:468 start_codon:yes stop_codon:yes gene_type:complete